MRTIITIIFGIIPLLGITQTDTICNINFISKVNSQVSTLSEQLCYQFLRSIDSVCLDNVEFQEYCNETVFKILEFNPMILLSTVDKHRKTINIDLINNLVANPINDQIDLLKIKHSLSEIRYSGSAKKETINSLDKAILINTRKK